MSAPVATRVDPITASVIAGALDSIAVEMGHKLARMSYSSIIRESEDFGCVICDAEARQLAESSQSTPLQSGPIPGYIRGINRRFAELGEEWKPGDVVIHNHAYYGASHGPDVAFVVPIFQDGELIAFSATTAHHLDLGALTPGSCGIVDATDAYAEGLQFNAIKIEEEGRRNEWFWRFIRDNVRAPQLVVGDMEAQLGACRIGAERFHDLLARYGVATVRAAGEDLMDYSERLLRREIEKLPDGSYEAEGFIDGFEDHPDPAYKNLRVKATVSVEGPGINVADTVMRALAPLVPHNVSAGVGNLKVVAYSGLLEGGRHWVYMDIQEGSYGGRYGKDGLDAVDTLYANTRNNPIEDIESHYPLRVTRYELNVDTGGPGRWRGGLGTIRELEFLAPGGMSLEGDGSVHPPPGLFGGGDGTPGRVEINHRGEDGVDVPSKFPYRSAQAGDRLLLIAPSGGGYGDAGERDPQAVREDVADELLSPERARDLYGPAE